MSLIDGFARSLRLVLTATTFLFGVLVGLGVIAAARPARADQDVVLKAKASPELMAFARHYFLHEWPPLKDDPYILEEMKEQSKDPETYVDELIKKGQADVNGDGVPELIFELDSPYFCGEVGCDMVILQKQGKKWRVIMDDSGSAVITILDKTDSGYHRLCTGFLVKWLGDHYDEIPVEPSKRPSWDLEGSTTVTCDQ